MRLRVLLVEDDPDVGRILRRMLALRYEALLATSYVDALRLAAEFRPHVVVSDYDLGSADHDGLWLLRRLELPGIVLTGHQLPAVEYTVLRKPTSLAVLKETIDGLLGTTPQV